LLQEFEKEIEIDRKNRADEDLQQRSALAVISKNVWKSSKLFDIDSSANMQ